MEKRCYILDAQKVTQLLRMLIDCGVGSCIGPLCPFMLVISITFDCRCLHSPKADWSEKRCFHGQLHVPS